MITLHFKQQCPTRANLGVDVTGAHANKKMHVLRETKTVLTLISGGK